MATLTLPRVFINNVSDPSAYVTAYAGPDRARRLAAEGGVRTYGEGRRRAVGQVGRMNTITVRLTALNELAVVALEEWVGEHVMYRDDRGRRFVCVYYGLEYREYKAEKQTYDVTLTMEEVSWGEKVAE